jgi:hypothetical protein
VEEGGGDRVAASLGGGALPEGEGAVDLAEPREEQLHDVGRAHRVGEPRVFGPGKGERGEPELPDAPKTLHLSRPEETRDDGRLFRFERDESVDGIPKNHEEVPKGSPWYMLERSTA